ncbi:S8 family serine peptidase [Flavobacterium pedocola]
MKKFLIVFCLLFALLSFSQNNGVYSYYLTLNDHKKAPQFERIDGMLVYQGTDESVSKIFSKYELINFEQAFPYAIDRAVLNVFFVETTSGEMVPELLSELSSDYRAAEDISKRKIDFLYYPNDYGTTSMVPNLGADVSRKELDYHKAPQAWDITKGSPKIKLGISDTPLQYGFDDFAGKVTLTSSSTPYSYSPTAYYHATSVAALAAARGDNAHGSVGVCMDCDIVEGGMWIGSGSYVNGEIVSINSNLYNMARAGARVINMSWTNSGYTNSTTYSTVEQAVINDLVNNYRVTLVAAAGNKASLSTPQSFHSMTGANGVPNGVNETPFGTLYVFPASYDNVISVSSVSHKNPGTLPITDESPSYCCTSSWFPVHLDIEDAAIRCVGALDPYNPMVAPRNGYYQNQYNPDGFQRNFTLNDKVDILATGYGVFGYSEWVNSNGANPAGWGTSYSAPIVTGTIGLMLTVNDCLFPKEIESILKLTSKDIEFRTTINQGLEGTIGSGKLEIYPAVDFVDEMRKTNGNAVIDNHVFNRFEFELYKINNRLTINDVDFVDDAKADFKARNVIEITVRSDFRPNENGFVDLRIDENISIDCTPVVFEKNSSAPVKASENLVKSVLYPNPNNGAFTININRNAENVSVTVYDIYGKKVYDSNEKEAIFNLNLGNLASGMYIVKLQGKSFNETLKFTKK